MTDHAKSIVDLSSLFVAWAAVIEWLPEAAALMSIIWSCIRIYEWWCRRR